MSTTNTESPSIKASDKKPVEKHPILLHMMYNEEGSMCPFKMSGWTFLFIVVIVACFMYAFKSGKSPSASVSGGAASVSGGAASVRALAPSADELLSELSSF